MAHLRMSQRLLAGLTGCFDRNARAIAFAGETVGMWNGVSIGYHAAPEQADQCREDEASVSRVVVS